MSNEMGDERGAGDAIDVIVRKDTPLPSVLGVTAINVREELYSLRNQNAPEAVEMGYEVEVVEELVPHSGMEEFAGHLDVGNEDDYEEMDEGDDDYYENEDDFFGTLAEMDEAALFGESKDYSKMCFADAITWFSFWPSFLELYDCGDTKLLSYLTDPYHIPQLITMLNYPSKSDSEDGEIEKGDEFEEGLYEQVLPRMSAFILTGSSSGPTLSATILQDTGLLKSFFRPVFSHNVSLRSEWSAVLSYLMSKSLNSGELLNYMYATENEARADADAGPPATTRGAEFICALISRGHLANEHVVALLRSMFAPNPAGYGDYWLSPLIRFGFVEQLQQRLERLTYLPATSWDHVHTLETENIRDVIILSTQVDALGQMYVEEAFVRNLIRHIFTPRTQHEPHPLANICLDVLLTLLEPIVNEGDYMTFAVPPALSALLAPFEPIDYDAPVDLVTKVKDEESQLVERLQYIGISPSSSPAASSPIMNALQMTDELPAASNERSVSGSVAAVDATTPSVNSLRLPPLSLSQVQSNAIKLPSPRGIKSPRRSPRLRTSSQSQPATSAPFQGTSLPVVFRAPTLPPIEALARYLRLPTCNAASTLKPTPQPTPLGTFRLKCVSLVRALLNCNYGLVHQQMDKLDLLSILVDLFFEHVSSGILHHLVLSILSDFLYMENQTMVVDWMRRTKLLDRVADAVTRGAPAAGAELASFCAPGYLPFLYQLCYKLHSVSKMSPELGAFVASNDAWISIEGVAVQKKEELDKPFADKVALRLAPDTNDLFTSQ